MPLHTQTISEPFRPKGRRREASGRRGADCPDLDNGFQVGDDFFRSLFSSAGIALAVTFADGRFAKVNAALCSMLGWTEVELLSRQLKDVVRPESKPALAEIAKALTAKPTLRVEIVGHTDDRGTAAYNLDLSRRRAANVEAALVREHGIAAGRLTSSGAGSGAPVASNDTEEGRAKNRRVELVAR